MKKLAIVTGDSKGFGKAIVETLLEESFDVVGLSRSEVKTSAYKHFSVDLLDHKKVQSLLDSLSFEDYEEVFLIHNAAFLEPMGIIKGAKAHQMVKHVELNLTVPLVLNSWFCKLLEHLEARKTIISISSGAALRAYPGWAAYCSTKAGIEMMTRVIAEEQTQSERPIEIWNYNPGVMDTDMQAVIRTHTEMDFPNIKKFQDLHKEDKLKDPYEVAKDLVKKMESPQESGTTVVFG